MAAQTRLKNEFTEDEKYHNIMRWFFYVSLSEYFQSYIIVFLVFNAVANGVLAATSSQADALYKTVLTDYNKEVSPVLDQENTVFVNTSVGIININNFDELSGSLELSMTFLLVWQEERISWNASDYGMISSILVPEELLWTPKVYLGEAAKNIEEIGAKSGRLRVFSDGKVIWYQPEIIHSTCAVDVTMFPFDTQTCNLQFITQEYSYRELTLKSTNPSLNVRSFTENSQWILKSSEISSKIPVAHYNSRLHLKLVLERRYIFYIFYILCPVLFLSLLNMVVFCMPPSSGERTSVAVTIFLAFIVYMSVLNDTVPASSNPVAYIYVIVFSLVLYSSFIILLCAVSLRIYDRTGAVPIRTQKALGFLRLWWILQRKQNGKEEHVQTISILPESECAISSKEKDAVADNTRKFDNALEKTEKENMTWKLVGNTFDLYCFFGCLGFILILTLSFVSQST